MTLVSLAKSVALWGAPAVIAVVVWASTDGRDTDAEVSARVAEQLGPFATIDSLTVEAIHYHGPGGKSTWVVEYDLVGERYTECPGGLRAFRSIYDANGLQIFPTIVTESSEPRRGTGAVEFSTIELPVTLPLVVGKTYTFQLDAYCLDELGRPKGLPARSPLVHFRASDAYDG